MSAVGEGEGERGREGGREVTAERKALFSQRERATAHIDGP